MKAKGSVRIFPTEDPIKVRRSIENIFPDAEITEKGDLFSFSTSDLSEFINKITDQIIGSSAARVIDNNTMESESTFYLNKQAAFAGSVNFSGGDSTLGDIQIRVTEGVDDILSRIEDRD